MHLHSGGEQKGLSQIQMVTAEIEEKKKRISIKIYRRAFPIGPSKLRTLRGNESSGERSNPLVQPLRGVL